MPEPILVVRNLEKVYRTEMGTTVRETRALSGINVEVADHEFVSLVGPSGCGKTTLLRIIGGLIQPSSGTILIKGKEVKGPGYDRGFVFQDIGLMPWRTVKENIALGLEYQGVPKPERDRISVDLAKRVGLGEFLEYHPHELSGGMQQRVGLARALAIDPEILLMDEPFGALDALTRGDMQQELLRLWRETKKTVLFVTHDVDEALSLSDRILLMHRGSVIENLRIESPRTPEAARFDWYWELRKRILDLLHGKAA